MTFLELLQAGDSSIAIGAAILGAGIFIWRWRKNAIESLRKDLSLVWTNEGDITSRERRFLNLDLMLEHGELYGSLECPRSERPFEVHVTPRWFLRGRRHIAPSRSITSSGCQGQTYLKG